MFDCAQNGLSGTLYIKGAEGGHSRCLFPVGKKMALQTKSFLFVIFALALFLPSQALAHGTEGEIAVRQGLLVEAKYSDGEPMAYANISISRMGEDTPFQQGNLDRRGRFLFLPDQNGTWTVEITDGMGHRLALSRKVEDLDSFASLETGKRQEKEGLPLALKLGMGLAVILGLSGIWAWWASRHQS